MTFATRVLFCRKGGAAANDGLTFVGIVAIRATDSLAPSHSAAMSALQDWMSVRQTEFSSFVQVALEAGLGRTVGINDSVCGASGFFVDTPGPVAGFATHVHSIGPGCLQFGMGGCREIGMNVCVALGACLRPHKRSAWNLRRSNHGAIDRRAGKEHTGGNGRKGNSNRSPGKTPLGRRPQVRSISAHKLPFRPKAQNNSADEQTTAFQKPRVNNSGHFTAQPSSPARLTFAVKVDGRVKRCTNPGSSATRGLAKSNPLLASALFRWTWELLVDSPVCDPIRKVVRRRP
jgi:hypothetical protein